MKFNQMISAITISLAVMSASTVQAQEKYDDGMSVSYAAALAGKKVAFVPLAMSFDITEGWVAGLQKQADSMGYELIIRDPNWDVSAGAQAIGQLIAEKPDVLIVHNPDLQTYSRSIQKAMKAGIYVIQVNLKAAINSDVYIGADWFKIGVKQAELMEDMCGKDNGKSGKVAIIQGVPTNATSAIGVKGMITVFDKSNNIEVVANQAADFDPTKAHAIALTILKQTPDLCGIVGIWDAEDVGVAAAINEAGMKGKVALVSQGAGAQSACDKVAAGEFTAYVAYDVSQQARDINNAIATVLQSNATAGENKYAIYSPLKVIDASNVGADTCWSIERIQRDN